MSKPPEERLMEILLGRSLSRAVSVAAEIGVADRLADGPLDVGALAAATGAHEGSLYRLLRALARFDIFTESPGRVFANNEVSRLLRSEVPGSVRSQARWFNGEPCWRSWGRLEHSVQTGQPAFDEVFAMPWFEYLHQDATSGELFHAAMGAATVATARAVAEAYDFSGTERVVDVGGGRGDLLLAILDRYPQVRAVLVDRPEVVRQASEHLAGAAAEIDLVGADFFTEVPAEGDLYILKQVLHDWGDERCLRILGNCRERMTAKTKLLVVERLIAPGDGSRWSALRDLDLLALTGGGRERTEAEFATLLKEAGFEPTGVLATRGYVAILEAQLPPTRRGDTAQPRHAVNSA